MQQPEADSGKIEDFIRSLPPRAPVSKLQRLNCVKTELEVRKSIRKCQRGKTCGPDELSNDWYRDHIDDLVPLLTRMFNWWTEGVPNREMNTILDLFVAVRIAAREDENLAQGLAMLLDFAKAYDSLSRLFLFAALRYLGFSDNFVRLVGILHENTRCRFLVNGYLSSWLGVTCGIRQGCALAPLIFILALELLYEKIENTTKLEGVVLSSRSKQINVKICGYADDTAVYVRSPQKVSRVLEILAQFGTASGLRVNASKSMAIPLRSGVVIDPASLGDAKLLRDGEHCRYLSIQVSVGVATKANWEACISSINARLHLSRAKTNTVGQRAALAAAVIIPKIVFVARHVWPPTATVDQLQQLVKRFVWGKRDGKQVRAWLGKMQAELPVLEVGIAVPNIQAELLTMAAMAVGRWASGSTGAGRTDVPGNTVTFQGHPVLPRS